MQLRRPCIGVAILFSAVLAFVLSVVPAPAQEQPAAKNSGGAQPSQPASSGASAPQAQPTSPQPAIPGPTVPPGFDAEKMIPTYQTIQEDWSSLQIGVSDLKPRAPVVGEVEDQEKFKRILVQVQWRPGDALDLWIILPKGVSKPPAVLYLYSATEDTGRFRNNIWAEYATSGGVAAVGFVSALSGHRFHDRPMKQWFISELQESLGSTVHDVKFILDYLAERGDIDMDHIGMFGEGSGGAIAIMAAAADPRIKAVDTLNPWGDWPDFLTKSPVVEPDPDRANYAKADFLKRVAPLDPVKWLPELKVPVRIQQVSQYQPTPMECKDKIKAAAPKQAEIVPFVTNRELTTKEAQGALFDWMKKQIRPADARNTGTTAAAVEKPMAAQEHNTSPQK